MNTDITAGWAPLLKYVSFWLFLVIWKLVMFCLQKKREETCDVLEFSAEEKGF